MQILLFPGFHPIIYGIAPVFAITKFLLKYSCPEIDPSDKNMGMASESIL